MLQAAIALFNRKGYDATSMGDLAAELGLTKSAIYHHVPSKEHLLRQALDEALDGLEASLDAATTLRDAVTGSVEVLVAHLPAVTLLLRVHGNSPAELDALRRRRAIDARLADLVRVAVREGSVRSDIPADLISRLLFGTVNSLVEWVRPGGKHDAATLAAAITTIAFDGLSTQRS